MQQFITKVTCGTLLFFVLWALSMRYLIKLPDQHPLRLAIDGKMNILQQQKKPKIVLIGDSNLALGIHSPLLKERCGLEVVNMGVHGGFGLRFSLAQVENYLQKGDLLLIAPVYGAFSTAFYGSSQLNLALRTDLSYLQYMATFAQLSKVFPQGFNMRDAYASLLNQVPEQAYQINMNEHGDYTGHHEQPNQHSYNIHSPIDTLILEANINEVNQFAASLQAKGVRCFYSAAPYPQSLYQKHAASIERYHQRLQTQLKIPVLGQAPSFIYPDSLFFDTQNHLNKTGKNLRTQALAALLQTALSR
jgi:hypothetical protein